MLLKAEYMILPTCSLISNCCLTF
uniref:Uncharacterized protein n=1 Tax=Anguilla anguilla TaxID=7936 RepID=A0A0E9QF85_ANGAN